MGKIYWNLHSVGVIPGIDVINVQNVARPLCIAQNLFNIREFVLRSLINAQSVAKL